MSQSACHARWRERTRRSQASPTGSELRSLERSTLKFFKSGQHRKPAAYDGTSILSSTGTLLNYLNENGIDAKCHYPIAIHQQEGYPWGKQARIAGAISNSERNAACCISLPMFPELTDQEVDYVIGRVLEWDRQAGVA